MLPNTGDLLVVALTWWVISLSGVLMPGPVSAMAVSEGTHRGAAAGPLLTAGHGAAEALMVGALAVGLSQFLQQTVVVGTIGVLGGVVLLWMGWGIVRTARAGALEVAPQTGASTPSGSSLVRTGFLVTVSNPYWLLWWATVGAAYFVAFSQFGLLVLVVVFLIGHVALDLGWTTFLALVVGAGRGRVPVRAYRIVLGVCGAFLMAMSGYFIYSGIGYLVR